MILNRAALHDPYWACPDDADIWPGLDFNRELLPPGESDKFPRGSVGIRIDDDFWQVAALPWEWREATLSEIVAALWPSRFSVATFEPDSE